MFGLYEDRTANIKEIKPLPLTRDADDYVEAFPDHHRSSLNVTSLPNSLYTAVYSFILASAARDARGQGRKHHSMLVHVTRYVDVQMKVTELLKNAMQDIVAELEFQTGPQYQKLISDLEYLWHNDFEPTTRAVMETLDDNGIAPVAWEEIKERLFTCASKIEVKAINGKAADGGLDYDSYPNGCSVIAVGGDKLSRGLTLEGLMVSYYARLSRMYDTLLQMGRWFGYRNGYADLCRLYTSKQLIGWYRHIAVANEELRQELDDMAELHAIPETYGLKVRTHPDGMLITAMNKMRNSESRTVTYAGKLVQITRYYKDNPCNFKNIRFADTWLRELGTPITPSPKTRNNYLWTNVGYERIIDFLQNIAIHSSCFSASPKIVSKYIQSQVQDGELVNWTVALVSTLSGKTYPIGGVDIGLSWRSDDAAGSSLQSKHAGLEDNTIYLIRNNLITETDQEVDLTEEERQNAINHTRDNWKPNKRSSVPPTDPSPVWVRKCRSKERGLLLIYVFESGNIVNGMRMPYNDTYLGYAISFPDSNTARPVEYKVDEVYLRNDFDED